MQHLSSNPGVRPCSVHGQHTHRSCHGSGARVLNSSTASKTIAIREEIEIPENGASLFTGGFDVYRIATGPRPNLVQEVRPSDVSEVEDKSRLEKGLALDVLRGHLPKFFKETSPMDIYAENVVFLDDISPHLGLQHFTAEGKENYASLMWSLRFHASLFCRDVEVHILRFWQPHPDQVMARWQITLYPRLLNGVYGTKMSFDGISEFSFNQEGKICQHRVDILDSDGLKSSLGLHFLLQSNTFHPIPTC